MDLADELGLGETAGRCCPAGRAAVGEPLAAIVRLGEVCRWIIVPMAPSSTRMRSRSARRGRGGIRAVLRGHVKVASGRQQVEGTVCRVPHVGSVPCPTSLPPAGALRLARVAGVPVYLDRTWLILGAFVAWTGWQAGRDLGTGTALAVRRRGSSSASCVAVLGHEVAHAVSGPAARVPGAPHRRDALGRSHRLRRHRHHTRPRAAVVAVERPAGQPGARRGGGASRPRRCPGRHPSSRARSPVLNLLLAGFNLLPGLPLDGGQLVRVAGLVAQRPPRPRPRRRRLVRPGARRRRRALVRRRGRWPRAAPDLFGIGLALVMAWILWSGATAALQRAPAGAPAVAGAAGGRHGPRGGRAGPDPARRVRRHRAAGRGARRARPARRSCCPSPRRTAPDIATLPASTRLASVVVKLPDECVVELAPGDDAEPVLRAMAITGWSVVVVTSAGEVRGLVTSDRLNAVAEAVLGRN